MIYIFSYLQCLSHLLMASGVFFLIDTALNTRNLTCDYLILVSIIASLAGPLSKLMNQKSLVILGLILFSKETQTNEINFGLGVGVGNSALASPVETRAITGSYIWDIYDGFYLRSKLGYISDKSGDPTRSSFVFASTGLGMLVDIKPVEFRVGYGLAGISAADSYLGGLFPQFQGDIYLGLRDRAGSGFGLSYGHISSASIWYPNVGRDFVTLEIGKRW